MSVLLNVTEGTPGLSNEFTTFMSAPFGPDNPALGIPYDSQLAWVLTLVFGGLFLVEAIIAFLNLWREGYVVHLWVTIFCLERVATLVFKALLYKQRQIQWIKIFEILEAVGTAIIVSAAFQLLMGFLRSRKPGRSCCGSFWQGLCVFMASGLIAAGAAIFAAGAALQDRTTNTQADFNRGFTYRQYGVVVYGVVLLAYLIISTFSICFRGRRWVAIELWVIGASLSAKAGFQIYAFWTTNRVLAMQRYYSNQFYFSLLLFPEILAVSLMTANKFVRSAMSSDLPPLPFTSPSQGLQHYPQYRPQQALPGQRGPASESNPNGSHYIRHPYAIPRSGMPAKRDSPPSELARLQQGSMSH